MLISKFSGENMDEKIKEYEDKIGTRLPSQLCQFLKKYNGGETPKTSFSCAGVSSDIKAFNGLGPVKLSYNQIGLLLRNGQEYLPIAVDSFGNDIVISLASGGIWFYDHETDLVMQLTPDLKTFIAACKSEKINPASGRSIQEREQALIARGRGHIITEDLQAMWQAEIDRYRMIHQEKVDF